ncbi:hypothetical protein [Paraburkholderia sp. DGU8]|uniref:hypothetical protein n=1 Tax=Paraburkholderia sp. DGU8 TaxID=3161997 RepID=UPI003465EB85
MKIDEWKWPFGTLVFIVGAAIFLRYQPHKSADVASWVQAIASVIAIVWAGWSARKLQRDSQRQARVTLAGAVLEIAAAASKLARHVVRSLPDRKTAHEVGDGLRHFDLPELREMERVIRAIPLHELNTRELVKFVMILSATVRQLREKVEAMIQLHQEMASAEFDRFFVTLHEMDAALLDTKEKIAEQLEIIKRD